MTDDQALGQRLQTLIDEAGMTQTALGQLIGVRQGYINQIFRGHKRISATAIFAIAKRFTNLNLHWLLRGEGEMWMPENHYPPPPNPDTCTQVQESPAGISPYSFKDTGITDWLKLLPLPAVMQQAGHTNPSTTMIYNLPDLVNEGFQKIRSKIVDNDL